MKITKRQLQHIIKEIYNDFNENDPDAPGPDSTKSNPINAHSITVMKGELDHVFDNLTRELNNLPDLEAYMGTEDQHYAISLLEGARIEAEFVLEKLQEMENFANSFTGR